MRNMECLPEQANEAKARQSFRGTFPLLSTKETNNIETVNAARFFDRNCHHAFTVSSLDNLWCFA